MFFPQILRGPFGRRYLIAQFSCPGYREPLYRNPTAAKFLLQRLNASETYWRDLIATRSEDDLRHLAVSPQDLAANLLVQGTFQIYALPTAAELESFGHYARMDPASETRYRLLPCNSHLLLNVQRTPVRTMDQAEKLLQPLALSDQQLTELAAKLPRDTNSTESTALSQICRALVDGKLVITAESVPSRSAKKNVDSDEAPQASIRPTLGPHDDPDYVPPPREFPAVPPPAPNEPAQSLEECERRLEEARIRLQAHGYQPKYSDEEIRVQAQSGELDDRFIIRFTQTTYANDSDRLGPLQSDGSTRTWVSTFNQLENADTDPKTLAMVLGIDNYNPEADYSIIIVDTQAPGAGQAVTIVPTYSNLGKMAKSEIEGIDPALVDQVMTDEYAEVYAEAMEVFAAEGIKTDDPEEVSEFANSIFDNPDDIARFKARVHIEERYGANAHYTGNGTTKNLLSNGGERGVMELLSVDKNPDTIGTLIGNNAAKRLPCTPS